MKLLSPHPGQSKCCLAAPPFWSMAAAKQSLAERERASVLVIVLWITFGLVSLALYFAQSSNFEFRAADNRTAAAEAEQAIEGAARYVSNVLAAVLLQTNLPPSLPDTNSYMQAAVPIGDAMFWLIGRDTNSLLTGGPLTPSFGLIDESSKLNLNRVTADMLQWLPNMTPDVAVNIATWCQASASTNSTSSSSSYSTAGYGSPVTVYQTLIPPYQCKSAPFETVDELRLVYGLTPELLYGEDMNLNGVLDANENDGELTPPSDNANGMLDPGLLEYVTVWSSEPNIASDGSQRINVTNVTQLTTLLQNKLGDSRATQILQSSGLATAGAAGRSGTGGSSSRGGSGASSGGAAAGGAGTTGGTGGRSGGSGSTGGGGGGAVVVATTPSFGSVLEFYLKSGMSQNEFDQIADFITTTNSTNVTGLVNINTANLAVLSCIPGITSNNAPAVVAYRQGNAASLNSVAWLTNVLDSNSATQAGPYITARSYQYSADIAAVGHYGRGFRRVKFIFDISQGTPRIVYRQDLTHLGWALGKDVRNQLLLANSKR